MAMLLEGRRLRRARRALAAAQPAAAARDRRRRSSTSRPARDGALRVGAAAARARDAEPLAAPGRRAARGGRARRPGHARGGAAGRCSRRSTSSRWRDETGLDVERVAAVHFRLGSKLELHWLRDRDRRAAACRPLGRAGPRRAARRPLRAPPRAHRRGAALRPPTPRRTQLVDWIESNPASERTWRRWRHPRRPHLRPHDAAGGGARGAQPPRRLGGHGRELLAHLPEPARGLRVAAAAFGCTIVGWPRCSPRPSGPM